MEKQKSLLEDEYWQGSKIGANVSVYREKKSGEDFAVKTKKWLSEEVRIMRCLDHKSIPRVVEVYEAGDGMMSMV